MAYRAVAIALLVGTAAAFPASGQTLRVAMAAADIPTTGGIPNNGGEGYRFLGFPVFDGLIDWDFTHPVRIAELTPGLATAWQIDEGDRTRWLFTLRPGVTFQDGTPVTADAIVWNLQRLSDDKSPQYDLPASAIVRSFVNVLDRFEKIDDETVAIYTKVPFSFFPYMVPSILMVSPTQISQI
jgi:peptide/nickel transport system substrate-binding protein